MARYNYFGRGDEYSEWVDCWNATGKELEQQGYGDKYDCECEDWELQEIEWYYYNEISETILSSEDPGNGRRLKDYPRSICQLAPSLPCFCYQGAYLRKALHDSLDPFVQRSLFL